ncbi:hypothetical protein YC2023_013297 [Brassica napus]
MMLCLEDLQERERKTLKKLKKALKMTKALGELERTERHNLAQGIFGSVLVARFRELLQASDSDFWFRSGKRTYDEASMQHYLHNKVGNAISLHNKVGNAICYRHMQTVIHPKETEPSKLNTCHSSRKS